MKYFLVKEYFDKYRPFEFLKGSYSSKYSLKPIYPNEFTYKDNPGASQWDNWSDAKIVSAKTGEEQPKPLFLSPQLTLPIKFKDILKVYFIKGEVETNTDKKYYVISNGEIFTKQLNLTIINPHNPSIRSIQVSSEPKIPVEHYGCSYNISINDNISYIYNLFEELKSFGINSNNKILKQYLKENKMKNKNNTMATKRERQLTTLLLKERLERLTGKKVILKEKEGKVILSIVYFEEVFSEGSSDSMTCDSGYGESEGFTKVKKETLKLNSEKEAIVVLGNKVKEYFKEIEGQFCFSGSEDEKVEKLIPGKSTLNDIENAVRSDMGNWVEFKITPIGVSI